MRDVLGALGVDHVIPVVLRLLVSCGRRKSELGR